MIENIKHLYLELYHPISKTSCGFIYISGTVESIEKVKTKWKFVTSTYNFQTIADFLKWFEQWESTYPNYPCKIYEVTLQTLIYQIIEQQRQHNQTAITVLGKVIADLDLESHLTRVTLEILPEISIECYEP